MADAQYQAEWRKRRYLHGPQRIPALGTRRRIQALYADGWAMSRIAEVAHLDPYQVRVISRGIPQEVYLSTAQSIERAFEQLSMAAPIDRFTNRARAQAQRRGWAPALAWDDIDDPSELPKITKLDIRRQRDNAKNARRRESA